MVTRGEVEDVQIPTRENGTHRFRHGGLVAGQGGPGGLPGDREWTSEKKPTEYARVTPEKGRRYGHLAYGQKGTSCGCRRHEEGAPRHPCSQGEKAQETLSRNPRQLYAFVQNTLVTIEVMSWRDALASGVLSFSMDCWRSWEIRVAALVTVVIPVYNQWKLTEQCLVSLSVCDTCFDVVVVDNGSTDATAACCEPLGNSLFAEGFFYHRIEKNINFGPACNLGARRGAGDYLFFLNNDTILTKQAIAALVEEFQRIPNLGAAAPVLLYPDSNRVQHLGIVFDPARNVEHLYEFFPSTHRVVQKRRFFQAVTGAALLLPRAAFWECGGFHEEYRNGFEDVDLGFTLTSKGYCLTCVPESRVFHLAGQSEGRFHQEQHNKAVLQGRWSGYLRPDLHALAQADGYVLRVTPWLESCLGLPEARVLELQAGLVGNWDPARCYELLQEEPYWEQGYVVLGRVLEDNRLWPEAFEIRYWQNQFCPSVGALKSLLRMAGLAGQDAVVRNVEDKLSHIRRTLADRVGHEAALQRIVGDLQAWGLDALIPIYAKAASLTPAGQ